MVIIFPVRICKSGSRIEVIRKIVTYLWCNIYERIMSELQPDPTTES